MKHPRELNLGLGWPTVPNSHLTFLFCAVM